MSPRGEEPRFRGSAGKPSLHERVAQFYYKLGLFCSTYPISVVSLAITCALICCYPLRHLPLPGNSPLQVWTSSTNTTTLVQPYCYVQQVVLRTAVLPWEPELTLADAFRAPIYEAFKLLEIIRNYQDSQSSKTLGHVCLHVEATEKKKYENVLPQYSCLVLSPANFWQQNVQQFAQDDAILTTIFNKHGFQKGKTSVAEMLFGMHMLDSGIKRYPLRNRQRIIQYAVTLFFKEYDKEFLDGLKSKLQTVYPLHQNPNSTSLEFVPNNSNDTLLIQYPGEINYLEFVPLTICFTALFLYYYFSIRKIETIKSKLGMAFTTLVTVLGSLSMTLGICFFFGLTLNLQGKEIFPYLVTLVGLENVLVLTKSVVTTPLHLDVKIRIAQGLSKEGWSITKNLLLELTILTFGLFTFVPVIQEFCIFTIVGLLSDFFLQMLFFSMILGVDIRRMENLVEKSHQNFRTNLYQSQAFYNKTLFSVNPSGINRSKSHPRLNSYPTNVVAGQAQGAQEKKIPKRLRLVSIWARTRFFQRAFMILMVVWICRIAYNSGIIEHYILNSAMFQDNRTKENDTLKNNQNYSSIKLFPLLNTNKSFINVNYVTHNPFDMEYQQTQIDDLEILKHPQFSPWLKLSLQHWPAILRQYNVSLSGQFVAVLPNIKLSHVIRPDQAILLRNPDEKYGEKLQWQALAAALDPLDFTDEGRSSRKTIPQSEQPFYPTTPMEIALTLLLCLISVMVLSYILVVLYRCICSRNYAEWRASWFSEKAEEVSEDQVLLEAVPVVLEGHNQQIECMSTDGANLVSACLGGDLKVWDNNNGELLMNINRHRYFFGDRKLELDCDENNSDYESGSPPPRDENVAKVQFKIDTNFSNICRDNEQSAHTKFGYDFTKAYHQLHENPSSVRNRIMTAPRLNESNSNGFKNYVSDFKRSFSDNNTGSENMFRKRQKSLSDSSSKTNSCDSENSFTDRSNLSASLNSKLSDSGQNVCSSKLSAIWCIDFVDNLIVIGCADGRMEFWEGTTGQLKCIFEDGTDAGVTHIKIISSKVVAARLYGTIDFLQLQTYNHGHPIDWNFTRAYRRTHIRTGSYGSMTDHNNLIKQNDCDEDLRCIKVLTVKAHQQPITCMDSEGGRVLSGSQDHTLKVFRLEDGSPLYTLHGHCGPITCIFIDRISTATSGSGSQDGMLCVWDLLTGTCMYNIQAHDGSIISLAYSASYVISLGTDERLCVWERFQGHLLNTITLTQSFSTHVIMLAPHLVVTARNGGLVIWDVRSGECVRSISLGSSPYIFIKQLILLRDAVICDYGNKLGMVRFPLITHKFD